MLGRCFDCGRPADHGHHVVPESRGGSRVVPLCTPCHAKAHHANGNMSLGRLSKEGKARAKQQRKDPQMMFDFDKVQGPTLLVDSERVLENCEPVSGKQILELVRRIRKTSGPKWFCEEIAAVIPENSQEWTEEEWQEHDQKRREWYLCWTRIVG